MATILERLTKIITRELGVEEELVTPSASFTEDFNAASADLAELMAVIEEKFSTPRRKVEIPDEAVEEIVTVQDLIDLLRDYVVED
jgi:acyl carrier protein